MSFPLVCRGLFNDEFGDTFGNIYVLTGKDFDYALLKAYADRLQLELQRVPDVAKVELIGLQDQKSGLNCPIPKWRSSVYPSVPFSRPYSSKTIWSVPGF